MATTERKHDYLLEEYKAIAANAKGVKKDVGEIAKLLDGNFPTVSLLSRYEPKQEWFMDEEIHGVMHSSRVLVLQELLAGILVKVNGEKLDNEALRWGSSTHDIGRFRENEYKPYNHGLISAMLIERNFKDKIPAKSFDILKYIVTWHCREDKDVPNMIPELKVLKDADTLERERATWADLDLDMLRCDTSKTLLLSVARHLLFQSFRIKTQDSSKNDFQCVMQAGLGLGIIKQG